MSGKANYEIHLKLKNSDVKEFWVIVERNEYPTKMNYNDILNHIIQCQFPGAPKCRYFKLSMNPIFGRSRHDGTRVVSFEIADPEFKVNYYDYSKRYW